MTAYSDVWDKGHPVTLRMPRDGYQNNPNIVALLSQPDEFLTGVRSQLQAIHQKLNGTDTPSEWLDYVAWLVGWSAEYWDTLWSDSVKRQLIVISNSVWERLGQKELITQLLNILSVDHNIWTATALVLSFTLPGTFDTPKGVLYIRLPIQYLRNGREFKEARRVRANFVPCTIRSAVVYKQFYLGISSLGDPLFN